MGNKRFEIKDLVLTAFGEIAEVEEIVTKKLCFFPYICKIKKGNGFNNIGDSIEFKESQISLFYSPLEFRGWDNYNKKMYFSRSYKDLSGFFRAMENQGKYGYPITIMQYSGRLDKFGRNICEGDELQTWFLGVKTELVTAVKRHGAFYHKDLNSEGYSSLHSLAKPYRSEQKESKYYEIIGDIYQNVK